MRTPCSSVFEPLSSKPLGVVTMKVSFFLALVMAKRVDELQAFSSHIAFRGPDLSLSYLPEFLAEMEESKRNPLPCSFLVKSLLEFVGDLPEEHLLCPLRAVRIYMDLTSSLSPHCRSLFVSP